MKRIFLFLTIILAATLDFGAFAIPPRPGSEPTLRRGCGMPRRVKTPKLHTDRMHPRSADEFNPGICPSSFPSTGSPRALVVLVEYQDVKFNIDNPADYFTRMLNEEGFSDYGATGSVRDFFVENSMGQFTPQFDVYGPLTLQNKRLHYGVNDRWGYDRRPEEMAIEACNQLDVDVDFNDYDLDGDGFIDNIYIFYADLGENAGGTATCVWPHSADIEDVRDDIYEYDGVRLNHYACSNETVIYDEVSRPDGIGTFVHEFSHVMGLPDLYTTVYNGAFTPGEWSTLDVGPYNNEGRTPPYYSAYERYALGWLVPDKLSEGSGVLEPIDTSNRCYKVETENPNEYFLLEYRRQAGSDLYIPGHGMLVWHVDYDEQAWLENTVNNTIWHQRVDLVEADNQLTDYTRAGDSFPGVSEVTEFTSGTVPPFTSWGEKSVGFALTDITESDERVHFVVAVEEGSGINDVTGCRGWRLDGDLLTAEEPLTIYDLTGVELLHLSAGESHHAGNMPGRVLIVVTAAGSAKVRL